MGSAVVSSQQMRSIIGHATDCSALASVEGVDEADGEGEAAHRVSRGGKKKWSERTTRAIGYQAEGEVRQRAYAPQGRLKGQSLAK